MRSSIAMRTATVEGRTILWEPPAGGSLENLASALHLLLGGDPLARTVARVLDAAEPAGRISFESVAEAAGDRAEDALLVVWKWRLLVPVRTLQSLEWDDRVLLAEPGEIYEMPNVVRFLVEDALASGRWAPDPAIARLFRAMREPHWERMPAVVRRMRQRSSDYRINGDRIVEICKELGVGDRMDAMIGGLKGSGVMSPYMASRARMAQERSPIYEMNPSLFIEWPAPPARGGVSQ